MAVAPQRGNSPSGCLGAAAARQLRHLPPTTTPLTPTASGYPMALCADKYLTSLPICLTLLLHTKGESACIPRAQWHLLVGVLCSSSSSAGRVPVSFASLAVSPGPLPPRPLLARNPNHARQDARRHLAPAVQSAHRQLAARLASPDQAPLAVSEPRRPRACKGTGDGGCGG